MSFSRHKARLLKDVGITPEALGGDYHDYAAVAEHPFLQNTMEELVDYHLHFLGFDTKELIFAYHDRDFMEAVHQLLASSNVGQEKPWAHFLQQERADMYAEHPAGYQPNNDELLGFVFAQAETNYSSMVYAAYAANPDHPLSQEEKETLANTKMALDAARTIAKKCGLSLFKRRDEQADPLLAETLAAKLANPAIMHAIAPYQTHAAQSSLTH